MWRVPPALAVFLILLASDAYFWHARDWNTGSRLMLTYAIVDRGTLSIDGLNDQTGDLSRFRGHYYSDKLPGYPLLATVPYVVLRYGSHFPPHPLGREGIPYWPADYWVTLATSGLFTAGTAVLLIWLARALGCGPRSAALVGLAYGLSTPAYVYATLAYGHQACAFALLAAFLLIWNRAPRFVALRLAAAGFLAALASVIELQVGPVSAILGTYFLVEVLRRRYRARHLLAFAAGALVPTLVLMAYNDAVFGSPWDMGYFHLANTFAPIHSRRNPLGVRAPDASKLVPLLFGRYRGLFVHAPILILALPGWVVLTIRRHWAPAIVSFLACVAVLLVNLGYPEWTGGWTTGPRLLLPLIPFAMIPVAGSVALSGRCTRSLTLMAAALALLGGLEMLAFQGAGGRVPNEVWDPATRQRVELTEPFRDAVWPLWAGRPSTIIRGFAHNLVSIAAPEWVAGLPPRWRFLQMVPLVVFQVVTIAWLAVSAGFDRTPIPANNRPGGPAPSDRPLTAPQDPPE